MQIGEQSPRSGVLCLASVAMRCRTCVPRTDRTPLLVCGSGEPVPHSTMVLFGPPPQTVTQTMPTPPLGGRVLDERLPHNGALNPNRVVGCACDQNGKREWPREVSRLWREVHRVFFRRGRPDCASGMCYQVGRRRKLAPRSYRAAGRRNPAVYLHHWRRAAGPSFHDQSNPGGPGCPRPPSVVGWVLGGRPSRRERFVAPAAHFVGPVRRGPVVAELFEVVGVVAGTLKEELAARDLYFEEEPVQEISPVDVTGVRADVFRPAVVDGSQRCREVLAHQPASLAALAAHIPDELVGLLLPYLLWESGLGIEGGILGGRPHEELFWAPLSCQVVAGK